MKFNFDEVIERKGTFSKWDMRAQVLKLGWTTRYDDETIPLFTADMDFRCAPSIQEEIQKEKGNSLSYEEIGEFGPDHDKTFKFVVKLNISSCICLVRMWSSGR